MSRGLLQLRDLEEAIPLNGLEDLQDEHIGKMVLIPCTVQIQSCRECGCTDLEACVDEHGIACHWVEKDLCSKCAGWSPVTEHQIYLDFLGVDMVHLRPKGEGDSGENETRTCRECGTTDPESVKDDFGIPGHWSDDDLCCHCHPGDPITCLDCDTVIPEENRDEENFTETCPKCGCVQRAIPGM